VATGGLDDPGSADRFADSALQGAFGGVVTPGDADARVG
jgi:hypothetical protein